MRSIDELIEVAKEVRLRAYAPYSGYLVGVGIESASGEVFKGCNVENISYGLTICAERNAISTMVANDQRLIRQIALVTIDGGLPCGMCLQTIREFTDDPSELRIHIANLDGLLFSKTLADLLPFGFRSDQVHRT
ncbi:MAG: cytidine deaminase [Armatimonadetes bacterium 55-13]|nr:cytidine deaminase [Armatimonadota bacterium]OJU65181.1 MAG: cytidine deaminase [Armatimonadetes bacterium 55-13]